MIFIVLNIQMFPDLVLLIPDITHVYDSVSLSCMLGLLGNHDHAFVVLIAVLDYLTGDNWEKLHYQNCLLQLIASMYIGQVNQSSCRCAYDCV